MKTDNSTFDIPAFNYAYLAEKIGKLNKRAPKLGCKPIEIRIVREFEVERKRPHTCVKYMQKRLEIEIVGESPKFEGWSLLAAVERLDNRENLVRTVPGKTVPESYRTTDTHCDHCGSDRRRKEVFILGHDDGRVVQVGRQCIADFLGHVSAETLAGRATWEFSAMDACEAADDEDYCGCGGGEYRRDITEFLATVAICIRRFGWLSRTMAIETGRDGQCTSQLAWALLIDWRKTWVQELVAKHGLQAEERDETLAKEALEWARQKPTAGVSDYEYNLGAACRQDFVGYKTIGIVASAIAAYQRHLEREEELNIQRRENQRKNAERKHVGEVGKRQDFATVTVKALRYFESDFGVKTLVRFETEEGNVLIWWASKELDEIEKDNVCDIRGTVVKHGEYSGCPQTELKRVQIKKVYDEPAPEPAPAKAPASTEEVPF